MLPFFACMLLVNLFVALIQWFMIQNSFDNQLKNAVNSFTTNMKGYWDQKLTEFEIAVQS